MKQSKSVYSLIPLDDFKALLGIDDREDSLARFCLSIAAHTIEQHCMRRLLRKKHFEHIGYSGDLILSLREYPVTEVLAVYALSGVAGVDGELIETDFYTLLPAQVTDIPY
jgi:hypothetical protein